MKKQKRLLKRIGPAKGGMREVLLKPGKGRACPIPIYKSAAQTIIMEISKLLNQKNQGLSNLRRACA